MCKGELSCDVWVNDLPKPCCNQEGDKTLFCWILCVVAVYGLGVAVHGCVQLLFKALY